VYKIAPPPVREPLPPPKVYAPPRAMTLGAAAARVRLIVWCKACQHQVEPDAAEQSERYGAEMPVPEWRERLVCSKCGSREIDMVVTGTKRRREYK
jgi:hypothetical protein